MNKGKVLNKRSVVISCLVVLLMVLGGIGVYLGYDSKADSDDKQEVYCNYEDLDYANEDEDFAFEEDDSIEKSVYEQYSSEENLDIKDSNGVFSYKVNTKIKDQVKSVKSTLAIANEKKSTIVNEEAHYLYMGSKSDCKYDSTEGTVECTPDFKWLLLNGKQPMAMYPYENDENKILSPVYLPEKDAVEYIVISKNNDDYVIEGLYKDGNIFSISNGTKLAPAYASYDMEIVDIQENGANVTEVYDDNIYTYGRDFKISYDVLPKDTYVYGMNIIYAENNGNNYGYYTNGKEVIFQGTEAKDTCKTSGEDSEYKYVKGLDYLKEMIKNNLSISSKDRRQAKRHFLRGEKRSKGYIATRNYRVINTALRTDTEDTLEEDDKLTIEALDRITENNKLSKNTLLVRNVNLDYLTSVFNIKLQDGSGLTNEEFMKMSNETKLYILEEFKKFEGTAVKEKAYLSTSLIPSANIMNDKPVRFIIKAPKGTKGYLTLNIGESEFVMPRNTSLVLDTINYDETNDKYIVEATVVQE